MKSKESIKLKRGQKEIVLKKIPDRFAVRLKKGIAKDTPMFEASYGKPETEAKHIDSAHLDNMEIYSIEESKMEGTVDNLRTISQTEVVTHMYSSGDSSEGAFIPTGTMTIQFDPKLEKKDREKLLKTHGLEILRELDYLPHGYIVRLTSSSTKNPLKIAHILQAQDGIVIAEPDLSFKVSYKFIPTDTLYPE